jgi:nicotinamidase-related amidase
MSIAGLRFGAVENAVHICVDMQRLFAEETEWASPVVQEIAPVVAGICEHAPERTIFTRFLTPHRVEDAKGQWRAYYRRWSSVLAGQHDPDIFELLPELRRFAPPARVIDKHAHSGFENPGLQTALDELSAEAIIFTGVETEVCVLATALTAIDRGYRTLLVSDAIGSSDMKSHQACLDRIFARYDQQLELIDSSTLLASWKP